LADPSAEIAESKPLCLPRLWHTQQTRLNKFNQGQEILSLRVFIVDSSVELQDALRQSLDDLQLARCVGSASTPSQAQDWLQANAQGWDVLVVEPELRPGNGLALLELCRDRAPGQSLLVLTHHATDAMRQYCLAQGADAVFDKSSQLVAFLSQLGQLKQAQVASR
jgi:DNA-binding NarL/FixJ family response regulator